MKIQVVSDLHLEFEDIDIPNAGGTDVLILSGDILVGEYLHEYPKSDSLWDLGSNCRPGRTQICAERFRDFLDRVSQAFPQVIYVAGNHEFYHGKFHGTLKDLREECDRFANISFLEQDTQVIDDVMFVGATVWTDCNRGDPQTQYALSDMMNDFRIIRNDRENYTKLRPNHIMKRHVETMDYFRDVIDAAGSDQKVVVVGHHAPTYKSIHPKYANERLMTGGYASDLSEFILDRPQIRLWTHGHVHNACDYQVGDTRVFCNPRGYASAGEETGWNPLEVVEV